MILSSLYITYLLRSEISLGTFLQQTYEIFQLHCSHFREVFSLHNNLSYYFLYFAQIYYFTWFLKYLLCICVVPFQIHTYIITLAWFLAATCLFKISQLCSLIWKSYLKLQKIFLYCTLFKFFHYFYNYICFLHFLFDLFQQDCLFLFFELV